MVLGEQKNRNICISFSVVADLCPSFSECNAGRLLLSVFEGIIVPTEMLLEEQVFLRSTLKEKWCTHRRMSVQHHFHKWHFLLTHCRIWTDQKKLPDLKPMEWSMIVTVPKYEHQMPSLSHSHLPRWYLTNLLFSRYYDNHKGEAEGEV